VSAIFKTIRCWNIDRFVCFGFLTYHSTVNFSPYTHIFNYGWRKWHYRQRIGIHQRL